MILNKNYLIYKMLKSNILKWFVILLDKKLLSNVFMDKIIKY